LIKFNATYVMAIGFEIISLMELCNIFWSLYNSKIKFGVNKITTNLEIQHTFLPAEHRAEKNPAWAWRARPRVSSSTCQTVMPACGVDVGWPEIELLSESRTASD
jgi:hypothetical protein